MPASSRHLTRGGFPFCEVSHMPATLPEIQLAEAVTLVRRYRHHSTCVCCLYHGPKGEGYCSQDEWRYTVEINNLLDRVAK